MVTFYLAFLSVLVAERIVELAVSRRNAAWAFERGGVEYGREHFRYLAWLHTGFFVACATEVVLLGRTFVPAVGIPMLLLVGCAQVLRYWAAATLGRRWNVRVIVVPGMAPVTRGPYRYLRHPNYLAVVIEGFAVPLVGTAWITAIGFTLANAWMLKVRIRCEERALARHSDYFEHFAEHGRLTPRGAFSRGS